VILAFFFDDKTIIITDFLFFKRTGRNLQFIRFSPLPVPVRVRNVLHETVQQRMGKLKAHG